MVTPHGLEGESISSSETDCGFLFSGTFGTRRTSGAWSARTEISITHYQLFEHGGSVIVEVLQSSLCWNFDQVLSRKTGVVPESVPDTDWRRGV
jgi:hypothetical protein